MPNLTPEAIQALRARAAADLDQNMWTVAMVREWLETIRALLAEVAAREAAKGGA
jgi:hypothetical protein